MSEETISFAPSLEVSEDKFEDKKTIKCGGGRYGSIVPQDKVASSLFQEIWFNAGSSEIKDWKGYTFCMGARHLMIKGTETFVLDYYAETGDWLFLRNGKMIILADNNKIELEPHESQTDVGQGHRRACVEIGFYQITREDLKLIADATSVEAKVSGDTTYLELNDTGENQPIGVPAGSKLQMLCQIILDAADGSNTYESKITATCQKYHEAAKKASEGCFIATASYGDYNDPAVIELRRFRDDTLLGSEYGKQFVDFYYKHGPRVAKQVAKSRIARRAVRTMMLNPLRALIRE